MFEGEFRWERVSSRITRIFAFATELMYLVEGDREAVLLDSGSGLGLVRPVVERLTDKPLRVLMTHGHADHAMGAGEFEPDRVYIPRRDAYIYSVHSRMDLRMACLFMVSGGEQVTEEDLVPALPLEQCRDLRDGDVFDLGGVTVEALECPGHTLGSLVFLIREERAVLLGDACNTNTFLFQNYSAPIADYRESLTRLRDRLAGRWDTLLASHGDGVLDSTVMDENLELCDRILNGIAEGIPMEFMGDKGLLARSPVPHHGNIVYPAR